MNHRTGPDAANTGTGAADKNRTLRAFFKVVFQEINVRGVPRLFLHIP